MFWSSYFGTIAALVTLLAIDILQDKLTDWLHDHKWRQTFKKRSAK